MNRAKAGSLGGDIYIPYVNFNEHNVLIEPWNVNNLTDLTIKNGLFLQVHT